MTIVSPIPLVLVGSMKAGTTSLRHLLRNMDCIFFHDREIHYFDDKSIKHNREEYLDLLSPVSGRWAYRYIGDDTPTYSYLTRIPALLYRVCPECKIIWLIREPTDRAISNYWHAVRRGIEVRDINKAFMSELNRQSNNIWLRYLERSKYFEQIMRYRYFFEEKNMLFLRFEGLVHGERCEFAKIEEFLGVRFTERVFPYSNAAGFYARPWLNKYLLKEVTKWNKAFNMLARRAFCYSKKKKPCLDDHVRDGVDKELASDFKKTLDLVRFTRNTIRA